MKWYPRENYLKKIRGFYHDPEMIKVITGVRRCGKSCLMQTIADELEAEGIAAENIVRIDLDKRGYRSIKTAEQLEELIDSLSDASGMKYLFIDEIHQVNIKCLEIFYSILEDFVADIKIGKDFNSQYTRLQLPKFTLIASTTNFGKLPTPFIDRFGIKLFIDLYDENEIFQIIERICTINRKLRLKKRLYTHINKYKIKTNTKSNRKNKNIAEFY